MQTAPLQRRGMLLLLLCTLMWSISGVMVKSIPWSAPVIAGARSMIAGGVMALYLRISGIGFRLDKTAALSGVLLSLMFLSFMLANKLTTAANAIVIQSSAPVFVLLYNLTFGKQHVRRFDVITVVCTMTGIAIFFFDQLAPGMLLGNLVALVAGILLASSYIVTCKAEQKSCMNGILFAHCLTAGVGAAAAVFTVTPVDAASLGSIAILGVVQLGIPYVLYGLAVRYCPPLACSLIGMAEAIFNPLWVFFFTGEAPSALALCGAFLVLASVAFWAVCSQRWVQSGVR